MFKRRPERPARVRSSRDRCAFHCCRSDPGGKAGVKDGLLAVRVSSTGAGDRQQPLHPSQPRQHPTNAPVVRARRADRVFPTLPLIVRPR